MLHNMGQIWIFFTMWQKRDWSFWNRGVKKITEKFCTPQGGLRWGNQSCSFLSTDGPTRSLLTIWWSSPQLSSIIEKNTGFPVTSIRASIDPWWCWENTVPWQMKRERGNVPFSFVIETFNEWWNPDPAAYVTYSAPPINYKKNKLTVRFFWIFFTLINEALPGSCKQKQ